MFKRNKYGNKKVEAFGRKFDSIGERDRAFYLMDAEKRGAIRDLQYQVRFSIDVKGTHICDYVADFVYEKLYPDPLGVQHAWRVVVEDFKGFQTPDSKLKCKLMKAVHNMDVLIVKKATLTI